MPRLDPGYILSDPQENVADDALWRDLALIKMRDAILEVGILASRARREGAISDAEVSDILVFCAGWEK